MNMTHNHLGMLPKLALATAAFVWATTASLSWADEEEEDEIPFDEAEIFAELNNTDGDLGLHALIDGEGWKKLEIETARERNILKIRVKGRLKRQGLTEIFFESAEPTFDELSPVEFFRRFPAGEYEIEGETIEGEELESITEFTHLMPAPPVAFVNEVPMAAVCDEEDPDYDAPEVTAPVTIAWDEVTMSHPDLGSPQGSPDIVIHNYEVVVEAEIEADGEEFTSVLSVILPPDVTSMVIPEEFIGLSDEFKYEVLAREESFNQTATESCFLLVE
jgi:hypothetical protein|tara:strand:+ start:1344 stop:2171 length:828 start_codon:yes stop_codon:yes gene_type:complete